MFRPVARLLLEHQGKAVLLYPYIDSGADVTLVPRSVGEVIGLQLEENAIEELSGIGEGKVAAIFTKVRMTIGDQTFDCHIAWALIEEVPLVLGRRDVFDRFAILFEEWDRKVTFTPKTEFEESQRA